MTPTSRTSAGSNHSRAFTLIELLVVIAIIGILSAVVLASLNTARTRARDTARVAQVKEVKTALEMFYIQHGFYPQTRNASGTLLANGNGGILANTIQQNTDNPSASTFISSIPVDPSGYVLEYVRPSAGDGYAILVQFEDTSRPGTTVLGKCKTGVGSIDGGWGTSTPMCIGL